ncbi:hypothetical protein ZWY2020_017248 [Hordeum vulgare]|nr:hypothetical protein ZWY2020_017248 [Hordeum vulgare]
MARPPHRSVQARHAARADSVRRCREEVGEWGRTPSCPSWTPSSPLRGSHRGPLSMMDGVEVTADGGGVEQSAAELSGSTAGMCRSEAGAAHRRRKQHPRRSRHGGGATMQHKRRPDPMKVTVAICRELAVIVELCSLRSKLQCFNAAAMGMFGGVCWTRSFNAAAMGLFARQEAST